jgi:hypothetical protein
VAAENYVVNESWDANGRSFNLADTIGLMVYSGCDSLNWVKDYTNGPDQWPGVDPMIFIYDNFFIK